MEENATITPPVEQAQLRLTLNDCCDRRRLSPGHLDRNEGSFLLSSGFANLLKAVFLSEDLRKRALLFISIEVPYRNHTYDVPIAI